MLWLKFNALFYESKKDIRPKGRPTQGVTLMRTNDGGTVVSIELVNNETETDGEEENEG